MTAVHDLPTSADVEAAAARIAGAVHRTPVLTCRALDERAGRRLFFKCENFQRVGAFKMRGAANAILALSDDVAARGVIAHSSGNHAQAVALAARQRGIPADLVMPENAPAVKRAAVEGYGATVHVCAPTLAAREETTKRIIDATGRVLIHPFDHPHVIAGQGTCARELLEEVPDLDAVITPVGGGGLLSGTCLAARAHHRPVRVFGAEPAGADDAARSLAAGHLIPQTDPNTVADGLLTSLGALTWPIIQKHVEAIFTADDESIVAAMRLVWERMKIIIEPSCAVPVAVLLGDAMRAVDGCDRVGVVLTGGNVDLGRLPWPSEV